MNVATGVTRVGVVGTGLIGASWAALFLSRGLDVRATDPAPQAESALRRAVEMAWPALEQLGVAPDASMDRLRFSTDLETALDGVQFVQESGPEREPIKIDLYSKIDAVLPREATIASSSSGLLMSKLQASCRFPERCVIGHPFNPPHLIPLVEVVGGKLTAPQTVDSTVAFYRSIGKYPIRVTKEVKGNVANRMQAALWHEAASLVADGVASVADVDAAIAMGPALRWALMGPLLTLHLGGGPGGLRYWFDNISKLRPGDSIGSTVMSAELIDLLVKGVAEEAAGRSVSDLVKERDEKLIAMYRAIGLAKPRD
jgi:carnitine 3-dehydrogenase